MYLEELCRILDLERKDDAYEEAKVKLTETWIKVNKQKVYVLRFDPSYIKIYSSKTGSEDLHKENIKTIDLWNPESGIYSTKEGDHILLQRKPVRQWYKSFRQENYHIHVFGNSKEKDVTTIIDESRTDFWFDSKGDLYLYDLYLGFKEGNQIKCNKIFVQDVKNWLKNEKNVVVVSL